MHNICDHEGLGYVEFSVPGLFSTNWFASLNMKTEQGVMGVYFTKQGEEVCVMLPGSNWMIVTSIDSDGHAMALHEQKCCSISKPSSAT